MACQAASHPETLRGQRYSMPCPTAKNWAPFVCGCAPEDAGANHDMRRVRLLDEQPVLATTRPANQPTGGSVLPSRRPQGLRRLSPADQRPGRITPAGDLTSSSPYPRHLTATQLLSSSVRSDIEEAMNSLDNPHIEAGGWHTEWLLCSDDCRWVRPGVLTLTAAERLLGVRRLVRGRWRLYEVLRS